jgi:hypothetical protein
VADAAAPFPIKGATGDWEVVAGLNLIGNIEERARFAARPEKWW